MNLHNLVYGGTNSFSWPLTAFKVKEYGYMYESIILIDDEPMHAIILFWEHGKSEGFDSCDRPSNLTQIGLKSSIFHPCDLEIWWMT